MFLLAPKKNELNFVIGYAWFQDGGIVKSNDSFVHYFVKT